MKSLPRARTALAILAFLLLAALASAALYGAKGYHDALGDADALARRADRLIAAHRGVDDLGRGRLYQLLRVEDPGFRTHHGIDITTPGAGLTTLTQSLSKRLAFAHFRPGLGKLRQTGYAMGLEKRLSKAQILALFLDTAELGRGPDGWMRGFFDASVAIYRRPVAALDDRQFLSLVAVMVAPARFDLRTADAGLDARVGRIERLLAGRCRPRGERDVWLKGCAAAG